MAHNEQDSSEFPELERMPPPGSDEQEEDISPEQDDEFTTDPDPSSHRHISTTRIFSAHTSSFDHEVRLIHPTSSPDAHASTNLPGLDAQTSRRVRAILKQKGFEGIDEQFATLPVPAVVLAQALGELPEHDAEKRHDRFTERGDSSGRQRSQSPRRGIMLNPNFRPGEERVGRNLDNRTEQEKEQEIRGIDAMRRLKDVTPTTPTTPTDAQKKSIVLLALARASLGVKHPSHSPSLLAPDQLHAQHHALVSLKQDLDSVHAKMIRLEEEKAALKQDVDVADSRVEGFKMQIAGCTREKWKLQQEKLQKENDVDEYKERVSELETEVERMKSDIEKLTAKISDKEKRIQALEQESTESEQRFKVLEALCDDYKTVYEAIGNRHEVAASDLKKANETIKLLIQDMEKWQTKHEDATKNLTNVKEAYNILESGKREDALRHRKHLEAVSSAFQLRETELENKIKSYETKQREIHTLFQDLQQKFTTLETASADTITQLRAQISQYTANNTNPLDAETEALHTRLETLEIQKTSLEEVLKKTLALHRIPSLTSPFPTCTTHARKKTIPKYESTRETHIRQQKLTALKRKLKSEYLNEAEAYKLLDACRRAAWDEVAGTRGKGWRGRDMKWVGIGVEERWGVRGWVDVWSGGGG